MIDQVQKCPASYEPELGQDYEICPSCIADTLISDPLVLFILSVQATSGWLKVLRVFTVWPV